MEKAPHLVLIVRGVSGVGGPSLQPLVAACYCRAPVVHMPYLPYAGLSLAGRIYSLTFPFQRFEVVFLRRTMFLILFSQRLHGTMTAFLSWSM